MPGPGPVPGEQLSIYDGSEVYWNIVPPDEFSAHPPLLTFTAIDGTVVKIEREHGAIVP